MSLRPEIRGFNLARFRLLLGSGDEGVIAAIMAEFDRTRGDIVEPDGPASRAAFLAILVQAVREGTPCDGLIKETALHVEVAIALAGYGQDWHDVGSFVWKHGAFYSFWEDHTGSLDPRGRTLFGCLLRGRPIFGTKSAPDWSYYGYLNHRDVASLRSSVQQWFKQDWSLSKDEATPFAEEFLGWLGTIADRNEDLWFWFA